jgi:SAM-dependent methyltransferase
MSVDYYNIYDKLYQIGYHDKAKNHGVDYATKAVKKYRNEFNSVLEIGCSNGLALQVFQKNGKSGFGIDVSKIAIRYACDVFGIINCVEGSILDIPFKDKFFDSIFTCDMFEHLHPDDLDKGIKEMIRVCKNLFFIKVCDHVEGNISHLQKAKEFYREDFPKIKNLHLTVMSINSWIKKFISYGLTLLFKNNDGFLIFKR